MSKIKFWITLVLISIFVSCEGDSEGSHNCYFAGKWCIWDRDRCSNVGGVPQGIEYRADGHFSLTLAFSGATTIYAWKSSDCETVIIYETQTGQNAKVQTHKIAKVSNDIIVVYIEGVSALEYHRL